MIFVFVFTLSIVLIMLLLIVANFVSGGFNFPPLIFLKFGKSEHGLCISINPTSWYIFHPSLFYQVYYWTKWFNLFV